MRQLTESELDAVLESRKEAFLAVLADDGSPRVTPVWFCFQNREIWISTVVTRAKMRYLQRDPRAALAIHGSKEGRNIGVQVTGTVRIDKEMAPVIAAALCAKYRANEQERCLNYFQCKERVGLILSMENVSTWG